MKKFNPKQNDLFKSKRESKIKRELSNFIKAYTSSYDFFNLNS